MSLTEWFGERFSPGPIGDIENEPPGPGHWNPRVILARGVIAAALLAAVIYWIVSASESVMAAALPVAVLALYCFAGYRLRPRPDYSNVGWFGGWVDNPFRISDDYNRTLVVVGLLLWPGRFVSVSLRDLVGLARGRRVIALPPRDE